MENPIKMDDLGEPLFLETSMLQNMLQQNDFSQSWVITMAGMGWDAASQASTRGLSQFLDFQCRVYGFKRI